MKKAILIVLILVFSALCNLAVAAPEDRFKGADSDGYDQNAYFQTETDSNPADRFKGASHDGYDKSVCEDTPVRFPAGTLLFVL